jgi:hypothetical protein
MFPGPEYGLAVMKQLREYRLLRDHSWTWKPTKAEMEEAKARLANGKPVHFDSKLPSMKERAKLLMDQRAYSVADLADILNKEIQRFSKLKIDKRAEKQAKEKAKKDEWGAIEKLAAEANNGAIDEVNAHIQKLEARIEKSRSDKRKATAHGGVKVLKMKRNSLVRAQEALNFISKGDVPLELRQRWNQALQTMVQERTKRQVIPLTPEQEKIKSEVKSIESQDKAVAKAIQLAKSTTITSKSGKKARLTGPAQESLNRYSGLKASTILIQWFNLQDAEYAAEWPSAVYHEWMGTAVSARKWRHTAPQAGILPETTLRLQPAELTEEEKKEMEEGVALDGESSETVEEKGGKGKKGKKSESEKEKTSKGFLGRLRTSLPFIGGGKKKEGGLFSKGS